MKKEVIKDMAIKVNAASCKSMNFLVVLNWNLNFSSVTSDKFSLRLLIGMVNSNYFLMVLRRSVTTVDR